MQILHDRKLAALGSFAKEPLNSARLDNFHYHQALIEQPNDGSLEDDRDVKIVEASDHVEEIDLVAGLQEMASNLSPRNSKLFTA